MSEGEDDFMCEDEEDYGLEYSEDSNSEPDVDLENQYYNSKALKEDEPKAALTSFQRVLDLEGGEKGEWGFKALKQMIKINFKLSNFKEMMVRYKQLLTYIKSAVTRNHSEKSINSILDYISTSKNMELLQDFYETTLEALKDAKNDRLWFKTNTKLGKLYYDRKDYTKLAKILKQLHQSCQTDDGEDDLKKGTQLLEIYALEIQMYTEQKNNKKLKALYEQSLHIKSAIPHPLIMGVIRECGGKMHLREGEFEKAHTDFFEAFKNYDESGSPRRTTCLKYLVLANMLMKSGINPFDSQEAKPYKNDPEILAMTNLVNAYQTNDINEFELILKQNRQNIMDDPFIREHIEDLLRNIRTQVLIKLINPYTRIHIPHISTQLNIDVTEVENLLVSCILDSTIRGRIDQVNQVLLLDRTSVNASRYNALDKWTNQLSLKKSVNLLTLHDIHKPFPQSFHLVPRTPNTGSLKNVSWFETPKYKSVLFLCSELTLLRTIKCISRKTRFADSIHYWDPENPLSLVYPKRVLFDVEEKYHVEVVTPTLQQREPATLPLILKMLRVIYQTEIYRVYLYDVYGLRKVRAWDIGDSCFLKDVNAKELFQYLHIPFVSSLLKVQCHYLDIFENDRVPNFRNYQVVVRPTSRQKYVSDKVYEDFVMPKAEPDSTTQEFS